MVNMSASAWAPLLFMAVVAYFIISSEVSKHGTKSIYTKYDNLQEDAQITRIDHNTTGMTTANATIHSTVHFSDGFQYLCHKYDMDIRFGGGTIFISPKTLELIKNEAVNAHKEAFEKQQKRLTRKKRLKEFFNS